jgi:hypothetical protein
MTTTPARATRSVTTTIRRRARRSWTRWPATPTRCWGRWMAADLRGHGLRRWRPVGRARGGRRVNVMCKTQSPSAPGGHLAKDAFTIDLHAATVTCPAGHLAPPTAIADGQIARFGKACLGSLLAARCTTAPGGRTIQGAHKARDQAKSEFWHPSRARLPSCRTAVAVPSPAAPLGARRGLRALRALGRRFAPRLDSHGPVRSRPSRW